MSINATNTIVPQKEDVKKPSSLIIIMIVSLPPLGNMWSAPALKEIATSFQLTMGQSSLLLSIFMLGYAVSQIFYGSVSNLFGRKKTMNIGFSIAILGALVTVFSHNFIEILCGRFLIAFGSGSGLTCGLAMIGDVYKSLPHKGLRLNLLCFGAITTLPGVGTWLSSYIVEYAGMYTDFIILTIYIIIVALLLKMLPETLPSSEKLERFHIKAIIHDYLSVFKHKPIYPYFCLWCVSNFVIYSLYAGLPLIVMAQFEQSPSTYGEIYVLLSIGLLGGTLTGYILGQRMSVLKLCFIAIFSFMIGAVWLICEALSPSVGLWNIFFPILFMFFGLPITMSIGCALTVQKSPNKAAGSAFGGFFAIFVSFIAMWIFEFMDKPYLFKEIYILCGVALALCVLWIWLYYIEKNSV